MIAEWLAGPSNAIIVYRYDWEKHSMANIVRFYVDALPGLGWVWVSKGGKTLQQNIDERQL